MRIIPLLIILLIAGCATTSYNPTVYPYEINQEWLASHPQPKLILATVNLSGTPTLSYLEKSARRIDAMVEDYLESHGYELAPSYLFDNAWKQAIHTWGNMYDPTTGKVDARTRIAVIQTAFQNLRESTDIDAVVFTDLIEVTTSHSPSGKHYARWHGVARKVELEGAGSGVPLGFNWGQEVKAASLMVNVYSLHLEKVFSSVGGLDTLQALNLKGANPSFQRRDKFLRHRNFLEEGIELAFHPLIPMNDYPGREPQTTASSD